MGECTWKWYICKGPVSKINKEHLQLNNREQVTQLQNGKGI